MESNSTRLRLRRGMRLVCDEEESTQLSFETIDLDSTLDENDIENNNPIKRKKNNGMGHNISALYAKSFVVIIKTIIYY